jgi:hypothetical protein
MIIRIWERFATDTQYQPMMPPMLLARVKDGALYIPIQVNQSTFASAG